VRVGNATVLAGIAIRLDEAIETEEPTASCDERTGASCLQLTVDDKVHLEASRILSVPAINPANQPVKSTCWDAKIPPENMGGMFGISAPLAHVS